MSDSSINASFWVMILLQTFGSFDPIAGSGPRKMPSPAAYVPVVVTWGVLQLVADMGFKRGASKFGWLMVLAGVVIGPFGKKLIGFINWIATIYGKSSSTTSEASANQNQGAGYQGGVI